MTGSVSSCVKTIINANPFISEMLALDIISFSNLAEFIAPKVEAMYGQKVKLSAIVMAERRYAEELKKNKNIKEHGKIQYDISMKTNIYDVNFMRNDAFINKLPELYDKVSLEKGDFLNVTLGSHEISLSVSDKYRGVVDDLLKKETIVQRMKDLVALTIVFHDGSFLQTPGVMYLAVRKLAWENINVIEVVSTMNVLTFVIKREDSMQAYASLQTFLNEEI